MDMVQKSIIHLLQGEGVFYASLLQQMIRMDGKNLPEWALAGVSIQNGRLLLWVDPKRLEKFTLEQVSRIFEHECLHLVLEHITRRGSRNPMVWNMATDLAVNSLIKGMDMGLVPGREAFSKMPSKQSADFYYAMLQDELQYEYQQNEDGTITIRDKKTGKTQTVSATGNHDWDSSGEGEGNNDSIAREVIKQAVAQAAQQAKSQGHLPAGLEELIEDLLGKETVNWRRLLKQLVGNRVSSTSKYSWKRESKRFGIDQKGKIRDRILDICIAIDTSGSISTDDFQEFMTEIYGLMRSYKTKVTVIECDADVQKVYTLQRYGKIDTQFKGRGGTAFEPVFEYLEEHKMRPGVLIYFTDLMGSFPDRETVRTIWVQCSSGRSYGEPDQPPFGRLVQIKDDK